MIKAILRWFAKILAGVITIALLIIFFPHLSEIADEMMPDESGTAIKTSMILASKLEESARLETLKVEDEGVLNYEVKAAFLGTVATINLSYKYEGSFGIDLRKVQMHVAKNKITFVLPLPEVIQDTLTPLEIVSDDYWYPGFSKMDFEKLLEKERVACRDSYLYGEQLELLCDKCLTAFESTIASWMKSVNRNLEIQYEITSPTTTWK